ncbi:MAG: ACT domain-containing protein [Dehalococcoidia bacterium]|nr:ACT domain-containing protein [Dehalococcoidia bacterium]
MRAVITVLGTDRVGIIAMVSTTLAEASVNILDITQTIMQNIFTMIMVVDIAQANISFEELGQRLNANGEALGLQIHLQREDIFNSMHRI